jgi:hypothetical protein
MEIIVDINKQIKMYEYVAMVEAIKAKVECYKIEKADIERFREAAKAFTGIAKGLIRLRLMN